MLAAQDAPHMQFPAAARERSAIASYPFRDFIAGQGDKPGSEDPFVLVKVIEKVDSPWLHALPDFANTLAAYEKDYAYKGIEAMFGKAYNISHVKETEVGDGKDKIAHVDLPRTFAIARKHGYKGYFSMEWDSPGDPYSGTLGLIEKTLKNLS